MRTFYLLLLCCIVLFKATGQPGSLDSAFGQNGIQTTSFFNNLDNGDERGKVVLTNANGDVFVVAESDFIKIAKYLPDGRPDSSYGNNGYSDAVGMYTAGAVMQGDKVVVAGTSAVARYTANGRLDSTFGVNGIATPPPFQSDDGNLINAIALQGDKIIVAGYTLIDEGRGGWIHTLALARYTANGTLDASFGVNGIAIAPEGGASSIAIQSDKIIVAGGSTLVGWTADGSLDSSFGVNGISITGIDANAIALQGDKIVVAGSSNEDFALARYTADGKLDLSFGVNGQVTTDFNHSTDVVNAIVLQGNKIIAGGFATNAATSFDFALARYTADGSLDSSFGSKGKITTDFSNSDDKAYSIALQGDKIIAAGYAVAHDYDYALARYTADGKLDVSFGEQGLLTGYFPNSQTFFTSTVLQGDKIIAAGYTDDPSNFHSTDFALARYTKDGALDASFGKNGLVITDFNNTWVQPYAVALQGDKILLAGITQKLSSDTAAFALVRYTADGRLDSSFGVNGKVTTYFGGNYAGASSIALQGNKILIAGSSGVYLNIDLVLARYTDDGKLDSTFGVNGQAIIDYNNEVYFSTSIVLQGDNILVAGTAGDSVNNTSDFALSRFTANGALDKSFGNNGIVTTDFGNSIDGVAAIALQGDKIVAAGRSINTSLGANYFALARYSANGALDTSFGENGKVTAHLGGTDGANSMVLQGDKIIVAGGGWEVFIIARYTANGTLDSSFGKNGKGTGFSNSATVRAIAVHENRLYAVGHDYIASGSYGVVAAYQLEAPVPTEPSISISDVTVCESQKQAVVTVRLSGPSTQVIRIHYQTHYITAYTPHDYIGGGAILYVAAGTTTATIKIPIVNDSLCEPTEQFEVLLSNACHATINDSIGVVTIKDDDCSLIAAQANASSQQQAQQNSALSITASPNPAADAFTIQLHSSDLKQQASIRVYDMSGRLLEQRANISIGQSLRLGDGYKAGTYIIEALQGSNSVQTKVIKTGK